MKNKLKRLVIAELSAKSSNAKEIYLGIIADHPEYAEELNRLAKACGVNLGGVGGE